MKVICTLDYIDGSKSKTSKPMDLDSIGLYIRLSLMEQGVGGITITRVYPLNKLSELLKQS